METPKKKTWAREAAFAMIIGCGFLANSGKTEELNIVVWPVTIFSLAAFGFKQPPVDGWMRGRPTQPLDGGRS